MCLCKAWVERDRGTQFLDPALGLSLQRQCPAQRHPRGGVSIVEADCRAGEFDRIVQSGTAFLVRPVESELDMNVGEPRMGRRQLRVETDRSFEEPLRGLQSLLREAVELPEPDFVAFPRSELVDRLVAERHGLDHGELRLDRSGDDFRDLVL